MLRLLVFLTAMCLWTAPIKTFSKDRSVVTGHYTVNGTCDQCKNRIESAAYLKGVKYAEWNVDTHELTLKYDSAKVSPEEILKRISMSGHDNEKYTATDEDYNKLPSCCRYRTVIKKH